MHKLAYSYVGSNASPHHFNHTSPHDKQICLLLVCLLLALLYPSSLAVSVAMTVCAFTSYHISILCATFVVTSILTLPPLLDVYLGLQPA